ncbi:MAG: ABC transporter permease [Ardenticatenaceae bacterium]|nr:ABC transporter permease [Ardenticatenaceae bacterium]MCB9443979.1 ABC transporter permease [Ardenticatenaceae bacterium]
MLNNAVAIRLATKEIWRNLGRFLLVSFVIALITLLVLFLAGLGEGLANANKEYLSKVDADLILFQEKADLSVAASQLGQSLMNDIARVEGVKEAAPIGFSNVFIRYAADQEPLSVSLLGVEPGKPGEMIAYEGRGLENSRANEAILDSNVARETGLQVGDTFTVESTQGTVDQNYTLEVVGISDGQQFFFAPSVAVPLDTWDRIRPRPTDGPSNELVFNIVAVQVDNPDELTRMADVLEAQVSNIEAVDVVTAYESAPGYSEQQSTIQTQRGFTLMIGVLVVGGFFQIQTLQKVVQVGVLKALGASNRTVALATTFQIVVTNFFGVLLGGVSTLLLVLGFPDGIPITFEGNQVQLALITLLLIGPLGGLMSIRLLTRVEPLTALGLSS